MVIGRRQQFSTLDFARAWLVSEVHDDMKRHLTWY